MSRRLAGMDYGFRIPGLGLGSPRRAGARLVVSAAPAYGDNRNGRAARKLVLRSRARPVLQLAPVLVARPGRHRQRSACGKPGAREDHAARGARAGPRLLARRVTTSESRATQISS